MNGVVIREVTGRSIKKVKKRKSRVKSTALHQSPNKIDWFRSLKRSRDFNAQKFTFSFFSLALQYIYREGELKHKNCLFWTRILNQSSSTAGLMPKVSNRELSVMLFMGKNQNKKGSFYVVFMRIYEILRLLKGVSIHFINRKQTSCHVREYFIKVFKVILEGNRRYSYFTPAVHSMFVL